MRDWACGNMDAALTAVGENRRERSRASVLHLRWVSNSTRSLLIILQLIFKLSQIEKTAILNTSALSCKMTWICGTKLIPRQAAYI